MSSLSFLLRVEDLELRRRIRVVMARLELLSEGRAVPLERAKHHGKYDTDHQAPPGAVEDPHSDRPPPKDRSLFAWFMWHFERAHQRPDPQWRFEMLCLLAERDLQRHLHPAPVKKTAGTLHRIGTTEEAEAKRVIEWYEGVASIEVAVIEECSQAWVEKVRERAGRRGADGRPKPGWAGWDTARRYEEVQKLKAKDYSQRKAADRLQVSQATVQKYWWTRPRERAA